MAVRGFPINVITLKEYTPVLKEIIIKNSKNGVAIFDNVCISFLTLLFCKCNTRKAKAIKFPIARNRYPEGIVANRLAKKKNKKIKRSEERRVGKECRSRRSKEK